MGRDQWIGSGQTRYCQHGTGVQGICFTAQAVGCLPPRRRPSSTDVTPNFAVTIKWMAANQSVSGSLVPWRIVLAVGDVCLLQWLHW